MCVPTPQIRPGAEKRLVPPEWPTGSHATNRDPREVRAASGGMKIGLGNRATNATHWPGLGLGPVLIET